MKWHRIITGLMIFYCLVFTGGVAFAECGVYDYSGSFSKQIEQNPLDRDYKMDLSTASTTVAYGELESKYIKLWDRELNLIYQKLMKKLNSQQIDMLTDSQVGWLQWHTKETQFVDAVWINDRKLGTQGAIQELKAQKQRLRSRTLELMEYYCLLGGDVEFEYQSKHQGPGEILEYKGAGFSFAVPAGWKAEKKPEGVVLTNNSIPGFIVITTLNANLRSQAFGEMENGIHNQYMDLRLDGRIYGQGGEVFGAAYNGTYLGKQVLAGAYINTGSRQGTLALVIAIQMPDVIYGESLDINSPALMIARLINYT